MTQKIYSIRDSKAEYFTQPFFKKTHGEAERDFTMLAKDEKSQIAQFPEDYDLYYIGDYDDQTGKMTPLDTPHHIIKAVQVSSKTQH
jgi:hypothetical protein